MSNNGFDTSLRNLKPPGAKNGSESVITVWLVEDNSDFRGTIARLLNGSPTIECPHHFSNPEDALEALVNGAVVDVIMFDIELTGMNGIETLKRVKSVSPSTRIIMLTAFDSHENIFKAICAGASGYLLKTASGEKIVESIHEVHAGGAAMTPQVARSVLDMFAELAAPQQDYGLTARERKILDLMVQGLIKKEIAAQLALSYHTVDTHLRNIYTKLQVHTRTGAVAKALKERLF